MELSTYQIVLQVVLQIREDLCSIDDFSELPWGPFSGSSDLSEDVTLHVTKKAPAGVKPCETASFRTLFL